MADRTRACLSCRCPELRTYRPVDTYCSACGHLAAQHVASPDERQITSVAPDDELETPGDELETGWRAALPSARFLSIAIGCSGVGLIIAGLATRFMGPG